jgi:CHAT domain-containing protein
MRLAGVCAIILLSLAFSAPDTRPLYRAQRPSTETQQLLTTAYRLFSGADYDAAANLYTSGLKQHTQSKNRIPLLIGAGSCMLARQQYPDALRYFAEADKLAGAPGFAEYRVTIATNRASVYRRMGDVEAARAAIDAVEKPLSMFRNPLYLVQVAGVLRDIDFQRSEALFASAIRLASEIGDASTEALAWQQLANGYLKRGDLPAAEEALTNTFRLRMLHGRKQLQTCYFLLGQLRRKQGRREEAVTLLTRAREFYGQTGAYIPIPYVHAELARTYLDGGQFPAALREFEAAVRTTRELRLQILPAETFRVRAEESLQQIFTDYVRSGMNYYRQTGNTSIAKRMLEVSEDSRAALFDRTLNSSRELPPEYWKLLTRYQRALALSISEEAGQSSKELASLRVQLADLESRLGVRTEHAFFSHQNFENPSPGDPLHGLQRKLKSTEAVLSFHAGSEESYLWALTRDSFEIRFLPRSDKLSPAISDFRNRLMQRDRGWLASGVALRQALLGQLSSTVQSKSEWILSLDGPFFELPFAALPAGNSPVRYLGHEHSLRTVPGVFLENQDSAAVGETEFMAVADARYNAADPRWGGSPPSAAPGQQLTRLPGTGREAAVCARSWGRDSGPVILIGADVNRSAVLKALASRPAVFHMAAHVLPHPQSPDQVLIALGLQPGGIADYLSPADIAAAKTPVGLVTLSGCGSASGVALPGLGLFGLTRAWLVSGASAVVATHWPIADDSGEILSEMYGVLRDNPGPITASGVAKALQSAQIRMAQSPDWRSDPAYWSAFTVAGKD